MHLSKYQMAATAVILLTLSIGGQVLEAHEGANRNGSSRPNVVMILADDQSYRDFGFLGNDLVHTPNIDRLASQSARYSNGYVPMSVCRPSLATLLTGLYPHQHGIHFNHPPPGLSAMRRTMSAEAYRKTRARADYLIQNVATLPRLLAAHGYACLQTGKHWEGNFETAGFTHGMTLGKPAKRLGPITGTRTQHNGQWVAHGNGDAGLVIGRETMKPIFDFVDAHTEEQPFFVWYAPFLPHSPFDAPERFRKRYDGKDIPTHLLPYYAEIARFDETVGQLIGYLQQRQLIEKTLIVFVSDNGFRPDETKHERQNDRSKLSQFEDGLRTPILIRLDGKTEPAEHPQLVHTTDLVPTILAAVGLADEITPRMRGHNLWPSARGQAQLHDRPVFGAIYPNDAQILGRPSQHVRGKWVRQGDLKLILPGPAKSSLTLGLFDLRSDTQECNNLVSNSQYAHQVAQMRHLLDRWWPDGDDSEVTKPSGDQHE
ncbi:MAG: sulfatase-like hydrolase/transferase [Pirellulaceae bacterium]|nr:sulfatase-like hydrolase/transferase [Pirellulaceae bacterium]